MNKKVLNWFLNSGSSYDSAFSAVMSRWTALGYTHPSAAVLTSLNTLVTDLKGYGVWTGFDALWVMMLNDASLVATTGAINYISPSNNQMTFPVAPSYTTSGIKGNATDQYALTNFNPSNGTNYTLNNASFGYYQYVGGSGTNYTFGHAAGSNDVMLNATSSAAAVRINSGNLAAGNPATNNIAEYYAVDRQDSTNVKVFNGTSVHSTTATSISRQNENFTILRAAFGYSSAGISMAFVGRSFSTTEHANIRTAILAHKSRLGL